MEVDQHTIGEEDRIQNHYIAFMIVSLIAAASTNNAIGKDNQLLWNLPNDMRFFKNTTWGMPVIMGRKTYESMAGEALPGRFNFVVTHQKDWNPNNDNARVALDLEQALLMASRTDCKEVFVIGGGQIYAEAMPRADRIYLTRVHAVLQGDAYFPSIDEKLWELVSRRDFPKDAKHGYAYSFEVWERAKPNH